MQQLLKLRSTIAPIVSFLKPYIRWLILGGTLFFLAHTLRQRWQEVIAIRIDESGWGMLAIALIVTLLAHIWAGWVWGWILEELGYHALGIWSVFAYLKTNIAKYLPGNVWHFYGRVMAARSIGIPIDSAAVSVVMEPLLMAIAALLVAFISNQHLNIWLQAIGLLTGLTLLHPRVMNPVLKKLAAAKSKLRPNQSSGNHDELPSDPLENAQPATTQSAYSRPAHLKRYPILLMGGELMFIAMRGAGFMCAMMAIYSIDLNDVLPLLSAFSLAWMLGLVVPGAPGGIGVFEATALALLDGSFPSGILLGAVAFYRLISTLAEAMGAGCAWGVERLLPQKE